ncbi:hypothetical protein ACO0LF_12505 [Undibacterium sp. Di27W]|uniref:hypothetical protein n=1 Tax=Undibacterium sp. Di27W TaxID=3413036 RepID=UPI003BF3C658
MTEKWDQALFEEFIRLRDTLRIAKKGKDYLSVVSVGIEIIELDKSAQFLKIATPIFLKEMGEASIKLGDISSAVKYFTFAKEQLTLMNSVTEDWQKQIELINKKLEKVCNLASAK